MFTTIHIIKQQSQCVCNIATWWFNMSSRIQKKSFFIFLAVCQVVNANLFMIARTAALTCPQHGTNDNYLGQHITSESVHTVGSQPKPTTSKFVYDQLAETCTKAHDDDVDLAYPVFMLVASLTRSSEPKVCYGKNRHNNNCHLAGGAAGTGSL